MRPWVACVVWAVGCTTGRPTACTLPALVDTAGWRRVSESHSGVSFALPATFAMDTTVVSHPVEGGQFWTDGTGRFGNFGGYFGDVSQPRDTGDRVCRAEIAGGPALIHWRRDIGETSIRAFWSWKSGGVTEGVGGFSRDTADLALFWAALRSAQIDTFEFRVHD